jgi:hypothetical protein
MRLLPFKRFMPGVLMRCFVEVACVTPGCKRSTASGPFCALGVSVDIALLLIAMTQAFHHNQYQLRELRRRYSTHCCCWSSVGAVIAATPAMDMSISQPCAAARILVVITLVRLRIQIQLFTTHRQLLCASCVSSVREG